MLQTIVAAAANLVRRKRVLMWADHVKLESPSILTKIVFFWPAIGGGLGPLSPLSTPVAAMDCVGVDLMKKVAMIPPALRCMTPLAPNEM